MILLFEKNFQKGKDLLILGHPTNASLKPKSKDLFMAIPNILV